MITKYPSACGPVGAGMLCFFRMKGPNGNQSVRCRCRVDPIPIPIPIPIRFNSFPCATAGAWTMD